MILEVQHETRMDYSEPVSEWLTELRMQPVSDDYQSCHSFHLNISQPTTLSWYLDGFSNRVHHFNLLAPHQQVKILAASIVETAPRDAPLQSQGEGTGGAAATFPLNLAAAPCDVVDFLPFRGPVCDTTLLRPILDELTPRSNERVGEWIVRVGHVIQQRFEYARYVTDSTSPITDLLTLGKGVCQDFAHLMIAVLRSQGVPARYVSGYIHRPNQESQSHAWCEAWVPELNWVGFDPTNDCQVNERFVRVAVGRDFTDVPPNNGTYRGLGRESISVRVATRELARLPPLSWHERLPPLDVPLTSMTRLHARAAADEQMQEQRQQQQ